MKEEGNSATGMGYLLGARGVYMCSVRSEMIGEDERVFWALSKRTIWVAWSVDVVPVVLGMHAFDFGDGIGVFAVEKDVMAHDAEHVGVPFACLVP